MNQPITDPALTARTFSQNPTLFAALERLKTRGAPGVNTGAEVPGGSDSADPTLLPPPPQRAFCYLIQFKTESDCLTEGYRVRACDLLTAVADAQRQATPKHPNSTLRVVSAQELNGRGAA
jgi:hypothetical protein